MLSYENMKITQSDEYREYLAALCHIASGYIPRIRAQFATKAFEKYQDASTRRLVLAYGEERKALEASRLRDFRSFAETVIDEDAPFEKSPDYLTDFCLNKAGAYADAVKLLFDIP